MSIATTDYATPLMPLSEKDWEALDKLFEELEADPTEQLEPASTSTAESIVLLASSEENGCPV